MQNRKTELVNKNETFKSVRHKRIKIISKRQAELNFWKKTNQHCIKHKKSENVVTWQRT